MFRKIGLFRLVPHIAIACLVAASLLFAVAVGVAVGEGIDADVSAQGMSVRLIPDQASPGDIVELRVEMSRKDWGRFDLQIPAQAGLRTIASETIPVTYGDGLYEQRQSLLLQPMYSGSIVIAGANVIVSTSAGSQSIELPDMTLNVQAFENVKLSAAPLPLPQAEHAAAESMSPVIWIALAVIVPTFLLLIAMVFLKQRKPELHPGVADKWALRRSEIIDALRSGMIPKNDLEQMLGDPRLAMSDNLRSAMECAVYSENIQPANLTMMLQKELCP